MNFDKCKECNRILERWHLFVIPEYPGRRFGCGCTGPIEYIDHNLRMEI